MPDPPVAIVTGGMHGVARALARDGYAVVVTYLQDSGALGVVAEIEDAGGVALAIRAGLDDELDVERLFDETAAAFGRVDLVVHTGPGGAALLARLRRWRAARESTRGDPGANGRPHGRPCG